MKRARPTAISSRRVKPKKTHESKSYIRSAIQEIKYTDGNYAFNPNQTGTNNSILTAMSRGTAGFNQFVGNTITPKSLEIRYTIVGCTTNVFAASDIYNTTRIIVHQWNDANVPLGADILQWSGGDWAPHSPYQVESYKKFRILADIQKVTYNNNSDNSNNMTSTCVTGKIKIPGSRMRPITFNPTTNTTNNGCIYVYVCSDSSVPPSPGIVFSTRLTFYD